MSEQHPQTSAPSLEAFLAAGGTDGGIHEGDIARATVTSVGTDVVVATLEDKTEGQVPLKDFPSVDGAPQVKVGDTLDVLVEFRHTQDGPVLFSKARADALRTWDNITAACEGDGVVEGEIVAQVKGGLSVDIGVKAFLPASQATLWPVPNLDRLVGEKHRFKVVKFSRKRANIVLSRRVLLEKERDAQKKEALQALREGAVVTGRVKNLTHYGAFVDVGGVDGLLHVTDLSWARVQHPADVLKPGDEVQVKVLKFDPAHERISLGLKQLQEDPWMAAVAKYTPGARVKGRVVSITDYGAFLELEAGVEGLIHISEMSWTRRVKHPSKVVNIGDEVEAVVLDLDKATRRISLGMKQAQANPWTQLAARLPVGTVLKGKVRNITDFGVFVGIEEGIDGLVHIADLSWTQRVKHPSELYKVGDDVEAVVLNVNAAEERISLGIKQLHEDPWARVAQAYPRGARIKGKVLKTTDFGAFIEIEPGIEGLCHVSEMSDARVDDPHTFVTVGQVVDVMVIDINSADHRIGLSIRGLTTQEERTDYRAYMNATKDEGRATLGDIMKDKVRR
ncbi:MAG: 30S ribosomal protein S1 [Deltaproteobacteria bacterium]|nr:30S ribosomal protein S1 [Deltaproteobacteria bacterium]